MDRHNCWFISNHVPLIACSRMFNSNKPWAFCVGRRTSQKPLGLLGEGARVARKTERERRRVCVVYVCWLAQSPWGSNVKLSSAVVSGICSLSLRERERALAVTLGNNCLWRESPGHTAYASVGVCGRDRERRTSGRTVCLFSPLGALRERERKCVCVCVGCGSITWCGGPCAFFHLWAWGKCVGRRMSILGVPKLLRWHYVDLLVN